MDSMEIDDDIYINKTLTMDGLITRVDFQRGKKPRSGAILCLGLLCAVLMMGNIAQIIYYEIISGRSAAAAPQQAALEMEHLQNDSDALRADRDKLQSSYASLTAERKQLETKLNNLSKEKEELQQSFTSVSTQRDKFKASVTDVGNARDQLQVKFNALKQQSDQLRVKYDDMQRNLNSLQTIHNSVTATKDQLQAKYNNLQREKDNLQDRYWTLMTNRDQIRSNYSSLKMGMDKLQKSYTSLTLSKNNLESSYNSLWKEKDRLQNMYNSLWRANSWLQANYSLLVTDRDALQNKTDRLMEKLKGKPCKPGWSKFDFSCYFISTSKKNWTESRKACQAQGADLVVLNSREEQAFINKKLKKGQNIWIGLTDSLMEGNWTWVDGSPLTMQFWQPGQPNSFNGNQDCAELVQTVTNGEWNDDGCFAEQGWICEQ